MKNCKCHPPSDDGGNFTGVKYTKIIKIRPRRTTVYSHFMSWQHIHELLREVADKPTDRFVTAALKAIL